MELSWVFKIQDWIYIAKYDSPFISDVDYFLKEKKAIVRWFNF